MGKEAEKEYRRTQDSARNRGQWHALRDVSSRCVCVNRRAQRAIITMEETIERIRWQHRPDGHPRKGGDLPLSKSGISQV